MTADPGLSLAPQRAIPNGLFLALDTSGAEGSVALGFPTPPNPGEEEEPGRGGGRGQGRSPGGRVEILAWTSLAAEEEHASLLLPRVQGLLGGVGASPSDLSGLVVGAGPGSFTGVRVGASTAKGVAWALDLPLWAFSSLAGAAADVEADPLRPRLVLFDARGDRVYAGAFRFGHGRMETLLDPRATTVGELLDGLLPPGALIMGSGALRHRALLEDSGNRILPSPAGRPSARGLLRLLAFEAGAEPLDDPARWEPDYLRESGAERLRRTLERENDS